MRILALFLFTLITNSSFGFVENVTKGYPNCMACHVSATGGGLLNDYGRSLSKDMMSTLSLYKGFEKPFYGAVENSENIKVGGQYRTLQTWGENNQVKVKQQFTMQNNVEFGVKYAEAFLIGTLGTKEGPDNSPNKREFLSERHYIQWETAPDSRLRVGKFRQHFGINQPNHTRFTKASVGFGSYSETYNLDFTKFYEWGEMNISTSLGNMWTNKNLHSGQKNVAFNFTHYLGGNSRVGFSVLKGESDQYTRDLGSLNAIFPISKNVIGRSEIVYEDKQNKTASGRGESINALYGDHQYSYKLHKGIMPYFVFEHSQSNLSDNETLILSPGLGVQFLPIPHVELQAEFQRRSRESQPDNPETRIFAMLHLYH